MFYIVSGISMYSAGDPVSGYIFIFVFLNLLLSLFFHTARKQLEHKLETKKIFAATEH